MGAETDGDGVDSCADGCPEDPDKVAPGECGCGVPESCNNIKMNEDEPQEPEDPEEEPDMDMPDVNMRDMGMLEGETPGMYGM